MVMGRCALPFGVPSLLHKSVEERLGQQLHEGGEMSSQVESGLALDD
jgi:hypothetical protein